MIESLVAIVILVVGVLGPLNIAARGISDGIFASNQLAANYLAQDALEIVINKRYALARQAQYLPPLPPGTIFNGYGGSEVISNCVAATSGGGYCYVDAKAELPATTIGSVSSGAPNCVTNPAGSAACMVFSTTDLLYRPVSAVPSPNRVGPIFTRVIKMENVNGVTEEVNELKVTVTVSWFNKETPKSLTIVEHVFSRG